VPSILELRGVTKAFGSLRAVDGIDLSLEPGEMLGVVGPNGAGKTTMLNLIAGSLPVDDGRVIVSGEDVTRSAPHLRCRAGIARTFQVPRPFAGMTVFENILLGASHRRADAKRAPADAAVDALERTDLLSKANGLAGDLTLLERKRLELARALAAAPRLLLLDEVAGGLTEPEVKELVARIRRLREEGLSIIWIEHIVHALVSAVDRLMAMDFGRKLMEGEPREVIASPEVRDIYLGSAL
jgi:branched-chain amino acid transport system ATP-binding protein